MCKQGLPPPVGLACRLPEGWAIARCRYGRGRRGENFALRVVLARSHCISSGGDASNVVLYLYGASGKKGATRALLSPDGVTAFESVVADVPLSKLTALRKVQPDPEKPPVHLILALRRGGVLTSMDSGLALPDFEPVSETVIRAWWTMYLAAVDVLADAAHVPAYNRACQAFVTAMKARRRAARAVAASQTASSSQGAAASSQGAAASSQGSTAPQDL